MLMVMTDDERPAPSSTSGRRLRELTPAAMWTTAIVITILTAGAVIALWWAATKGLNNADLVNARLNALKIGLSVGVGSGGVVALYLAWRRQHSTEADLDNRERALAQQYEVLAHQQNVAATTHAYQERVADDARADAVERRVNELYLKAVEQLGSDKAPVRLGGLYALERLAQDNETLRQTIVNVCCAYLRMSYDLPDEQDREDGASAEQRLLYRERSQEREVRLTAQRLLGDHLKPQDNTRYWGPLELDLTGAQLINFTLTNAWIGSSAFQQVTFVGDATFSEVTFAGDVFFNKATFTREASFHKAAFAGDAWFYAATFTREASFQKAAFAGDVWFHEATFTRSAWFNEAAFAGDVWFHEATFTRSAWFNEAAFTGDAWFHQVVFSGGAWFNEATFGGVSVFAEATQAGKPFHPPFASGNSDESGPL